MRKLYFTHPCILAFCLLSWLQATPAVCQASYAEGPLTGAGPHYYGFTPQFGGVFAGAFEVYLDRADRRESREGWLETARFGIETVTAEWERQAMLAMGPGEDGEAAGGAEKDGAGIDDGEASRDFRKALEARMEERLHDWLVREFFSRRRADEAAGLFQEVGYANLLHLFETVPGGRIRKDSAGDPLLKKGGGFENDLETWRGMVAGREEELLRLWEENVRMEAAELLVYADDRERGAGDGAKGSDASRWKELFTEGFSRYKGCLTRELTALFEAEERRFVTKRLRDQYSLRKKQEGESAGEVVEHLIGAAEEDLENGLATIRAGLEDAGSGEAGGDGLNAAGEISIDSEKWRESFRREFDKGLERWNRAEESLLEARVRWERDTNAGFRRTEEAWADAYRELTDARSRWEQEIYSVLEDGRRRWEEKEAELVSAVDDARKELEGAIEERAGSLKSRVKNLVEIILQSRETMRTAKESAEYWEERIETAGAGDGTAGRELAFWQSVYDESAGYAETAAAELAGTYGEVVNGGALKHHFLDDYQVELLKASALEEYWERELEISRAVYEYAVDKSSGRSTEAETRLEYEEAFSLYKEKKEAYGAAVAELKEKGMALEEGRDKLDELRSRLAEAGFELEEAREEYTLAMDLFTTGNDDYFGGKIDEYERRLRELRCTGEEVSGGGSEETAGLNLPNALKDFYGAAERLELAERSFIREEEIFFLLNGEPENEMFPSLDELESRFLASEGWGFPEDPTALEEQLETCLGLAPGSGLRNRLTQEYDRYVKAASSGRPEEAWYRRRVVEALAEGVRRNIEAEYLERREAIAFTGASDAAEWMEACGIDLTASETTEAGGVDGESAGLAFSDLYARAESEAEQAAGEYYLHKAEIEKQAVELVLDILGEKTDCGGMGEDGGGGAQWPGPEELEQLKAAAGDGDIPSSLAYAYLLFHGMAEQGSAAQGHAAQNRTEQPTDIDGAVEMLNVRAAGLERIIDVLSGGGTYGFSTGAPGSKEADADIFVLDFYKGRGSFVIEETDLASVLLTAEAENRRARERRFEMMTRYRTVSPYASASLREEAQRDLRAALRAADKGFWDGVLQGDVDQGVWDKVAGGDAEHENIEQMLLSFTREFSDALFLSDAGKYSFERYLDGLYGWAALQDAAARVGRLGVEASAEEAAAELDSAEAGAEAVKARLAEVKDCCGGITGAGSAVTLLKRVNGLCAGGTGEVRFFSGLGREYGPVLAAAGGLLELYGSAPEGGEAVTPAEVPARDPALEELLAAEASGASKLRDMFEVSSRPPWEEPGFLDGKFLELLTKGRESLLSLTSAERELLVAGAAELASGILEAELEAAGAVLEGKRRTEAYKRKVLDAAGSTARYGIEGWWYEQELSRRLCTWDEAAKRIADEASGATGQGEPAAATGVEEGPGAEGELEGLRRECRNARNRIEEIEGEIFGLTRECADIRQTLRIFREEKDDRYRNIILPLEHTAAAAEDRYRKIQTAWEEAQEDFSKVNGEYESAYMELTQAESEKEDAKHRFRKADELLIYATGEYLHPADAAEQLEETESTYGKVKAAGDALRSLYESAEPRAFTEYEKNKTYKKAYETYRSRFQNALALKQMHGLVNQAIAEQERRVNEAELLAADRMGKIFSCNFDSDRDEMLDLFLGKGESREEETPLESWCGEVYSLLARKGEGMLHTWGLAYWHLAWKDVRDGEERFDEHLRELVGNPKQFFDEEGIDYVSYLRNTSEAAYNSLGNRERKLLSQYRSWLNPGKTDPIRAEMKRFLEERMKAEVNRRLAEVCGLKQAENEKAADNAFITAGSFYALGTAFSWLPPVCVPAFASSALFMGVGFDYEHTAGKFEEARREAEKTRKIVVTEGLEPAVKDFSRALSAYHRVSGALDAERAALAVLNGSGSGGKELSPGAFADAVIKAGVLRGKDAGAFLGLAGAPKEKVRSAIIEMISLPGYLDRLAPEDRRGCPVMLAALAQQAEEVKVEAEADFDAAAAASLEKQREAVESYRAEPLGGAIEAAFGKPSFRRREHLAAVYGLYSGLQEGVDSVAFPFAASLERDLLAGQAETLCRMYAEGMAQTVSVLEQRWGLRIEDLALQKRKWEEMMQSMLVEGAQCWADSLARLDRTRQGWLEKYEAAYSGQAEMWNLKYLTLVENRNEWVEEAGRKAASVGSGAVLKELGEGAGAGIRQASSIVIPKLECPAASPEKAVDELLGGPSFGKLIAAARSRSRRIAELDTGVYGQAVVMPGGFGAGGPADGGFREEYRRKIEEHIALITAGKAREAVKRAVERFRLGVAEANVKVDEDVHLLLVGENFRPASGNRYIRNALVDDTVLGGKEHETQLIRGYENYKLPDIVLGVDLSESTLSGLSPAGVEAQIDLAFGKLEKIQRRIFGDGGSGEFGRHAGEMAVLSERPDPAAAVAENLKDRGSGEFGRISRVLFGFILKENRGWGEFNKPLSEKRLWDDDGSLLKAPTIRGLADIGTAVLVNAVAPGAGFALNLIDNAVFSIADAAKGRCTAGEALLQIGRQGVTAGATAGIGAGAGAIGDVLGGGFFGNIAEAGMRSAGGTIVGGAVNAVELDAETGGLRFNGPAFWEAVAGREAAAAYAGGIGGAVVSGALTGNLEGVEGTGVEGSICSVSDLAGAAADAGIEYGITGETTLNVLNAGGVGLLELSLNGGQRAPFAFGTGGIDMSASRLLEAARGAGAWWKQQRIRLFERLGQIDFDDGYTDSRKTGTLLRSAWAYGDAMADRLVDRVLAGDDRLHVGFGTASGRGKTESGADGGRDIYLASLGASGDKVSRLRAGIVLQHEAWRDGAVGGRTVQRLETLSAAAAHTKMALAMAVRHGPGIIIGDKNLADDVQAFLAGGKRFAEYVASAYSSVGDFWKLLKNGKLQYDGSGYLHDSDGTLVVDEGGKPIGSRGIEGGLLGILGLDDSPANRKRVISMMLRGGLDHTVGADPSDTAAWMWNLGSNAGRVLNIGEKSLLENYLHYLDAGDHYSVLQRKGFMEKKLLGVVGTTGMYRDLTFEEWSFENAKTSYRRELAAMEEDLIRNKAWTKAEARDFMADVTKSFGAVVDTAGPVEFLEDFRAGLRSLCREGSGEGRHHTLVHLTDRVFRGKGGDMGLAEALRAAYRVSGYDDEYASGLSVQAAAETYTEEYLHMIYGLDAEEDKEPKSQYYHNYAWGGGNFDYSSRATGYFDPDNGYRWSGSTSGNPAIDCVGFANLAYHSAGLIGYNERLNSGGGSVDSIYYNKDVTPTGFPIPGDLIFMKGHVGIYGVDDSGNPMIIHSAPAVETISRDEGDKKTYTYGSGPRINRFGDEYWKEFIEERLLLTSWKERNGTNYGRWSY